MLLAERIERVRSDVRAARAAAAKLRKTNPSAAARIDAIAGAPASEDSGGSAARSDLTSLRYDAGLLEELEDSVESSDARPTNGELSAWAALEPHVARTLATWNALRRVLPTPSGV